MESAAEHGDKRAHEDSLPATKFVSQKHVYDGPENGTTLEGRDDSSSNGIGRVVEVVFESAQGNGRRNDTRIIAKEETSSGQEGGRVDGGCETHGCE